MVRDDGRFRPLEKMGHLGKRVHHWALGLFGLSGALVAGTVQHVAQACRGNCAGCGGCAWALGAAVVSASVGVAGRTSGRRRMLWISVLVVAGLALYGFLALFRRGFFSRLQL